MKSQRKIASVLLTLGVVAALGNELCLCANAASAYTLSPVENGMQLKSPDGKVVFEYVTKKPENIGLTSPSAAYFHPVNTPSGERITWSCIRRLLFRQAS